MNKEKKITAGIVGIILLIGAAFGLIMPPSVENVTYEEGMWKFFGENAYYWFYEWGWTNASYTINANISQWNEMFDKSYYLYSIAHGSWNTIIIDGKSQKAHNVIPDHRLPYNFVFLASCDALSIIDNPYSWEENLDEVGYEILVGYSGMGSDLPCWEKAYYWQKTFFDRLDKGDTFGDAFNYSINKYPACNGTILILGNLNLTKDDLHVNPFDINNNARVDTWELSECVYLWLNS